MTCRCGHPFALHMALVRGKPFLFNGRCCQWRNPHPDKYQTICICQEYVRGS